MTQDTERNTEAAVRKKPGLDALIEDIFGLNFRGLKTIGHLFWKPAAVFTAARDEDWEHRYTPSIRLYFSLVAVLVFFQFIWAGENSFMTESFRQLLRPFTESEIGNVFSLEELVSQSVRIYTLMYPVTLGLFAAIAAMMTFIWGKNSGFVTRIRLYFAAIIPLSTVGFIITMASSVASTDMSAAIFGVSLVLTTLVGFLTVYRGLKSSHPKGRIWRAILFSLIVILSTTINGVFAQFISGTVVGYNAAGQRDTTPSATDVTAEPELEAMAG
ncbi:hypothetical protein [Ponticaulis sp.]|uniref:hypothetical protein n=1 Tax=Ponticaulis sp. TaxID=2020902 RepID=UPI000B6D9285|nr:hypothetical protein [Ponticaulis sp.]MAJ07614.1 hypothetical protein [Ponticaulis sp.]RPG17842.1 MAG: hypothetical protein CBC85_004670 [Hyphomonadaceae bacterium TMED125]HBH90465.1 hypothetical protein [Hyphomonadaceae bacterium]HBJ92716.1 hypothetical protein [Hyphomonadaceae bacterium]